MATPVPQSKAIVDANFETRLREQKDHAAAEVAARVKGGQTRWQRPYGWPGNVFDYQSMAVPFDRSSANADYLQAVSDPEKPGTTGDVAATTTMIDLLACMERAFRVRHTLRGPRAMALMLGRMRGHGSDQGPLIQNELEYVRQLLSQAKAN